MNFKHQGGQKNEYNNTLESLLDDVSSLPQESSSGPVDLSFGEANQYVVDQLWVEVWPIINILVVRMEALLSCFGVISEELSPFLRHFNSPSDFLEVYLMFVPCDLGGTDSSDGDNDEETDNDEDGESNLDKSDLEYANFDRLTDAISLVVGGGSAVADASGDDAATTAEDTSAEESSEAENAEYCWEDELTLASAASKFFKIIGCTIMNDLIHAFYEGIRLLRLDIRDKGYVTILQKYKTFQGRWFGSRKRSEQAEGENEGRMIDHRVHVTLRVGGGTGTSGGSKVEIVVVTSTSTKGYNKWYMC